MVAGGIGAVWCLVMNLGVLRGLPISSLPHPVLQVYEQAGRWLATNTEPDATIGYYEIGYLGYYAHRPIIDPLGLLDPAIPPHIAKLDFLWAYREHPPIYILEQGANSFGGIRATDWFGREYQPIHTFTHPQTPMTLVVFRRTGK
jgi:hypothetical protein